MKYCTRCKKIAAGNDPEVCPVCLHKLIDNPSPLSPVLMVVANGFELERIKAALTEAEIPFTVREIKKDTGIQILNSAPPENCSVSVSLSDFSKAQELLVGIGAIKDEDILTLPEEDEAGLQLTEEGEDDMSPRKRRLVKIFSFIGFLALLAGITYLADYLLSFVTPFLRH